MAQQPTQRGMIEQLLVKVIEISESQATQSAEIKSINKTIHNGMSHRIDETHRTVMLVKEDLEEYKDLWTPCAMSICGSWKQREKNVQRKGFFLDGKGLSLLSRLVEFLVLLQITGLK